MACGNFQLRRACSPANCPFLDSHILQRIGYLIVVFANYLSGEGGDPAAAALLVAAFRLFVFAARLWADFTFRFGLPSSLPTYSLCA